MQIVIEIADLVYEQIKTHGNISEFHELINSGIPLPKGHGRLIDADAYAKKYDTNINGRIDEEYVIAPTIIEADKGE